MDDSELLSIKNFSKFTRVSRSTLKFYDEIGLLSPKERGKDNNYRYYTPLQSMSLSFINVLAGLGVPLAEIKEINEGRTPESVLGLLSRQEAALDRQLDDIRAAYSIIHTFRANIQSGLLAEGGAVKIENLDETRYVLGPENDFGSGGGSFYRPFMDFCDSAAEYRINLKYPIGGYHTDFEAFLAAPGQPERFFSLDPAGNGVCEAGRYLTGYARGYYGNFGAVPAKMAAYAREHGCACAGPVLAVYLLDEICMADPDKYMARISVKVI